MTSFELDLPIQNVNSPKNLLGIIDPPPQYREMQNTYVIWLARLMGLILILVGIAVVAMFGLKYSILEFGSPAERLQLLWEQDMAALKASNKLPAGWNSIKEIQLIPATDKAKLWLKSMHVPILLKSDGAYKLEVLMISWDEGQDVGAIVQYNLVELKTNNMVWELGRTFVLSGHEKNIKVPSRPPPAIESVEEPTKPQNK